MFIKKIQQPSFSLPLIPLFCFFGVLGFSGFFSAAGAQENNEEIVKVKISQYYHQKKYEAVILLGNMMGNRLDTLDNVTENNLIAAYEKQIEALIDARQASVLLKNRQILQAYKTVEKAEDISPYSDIIIQLRKKIKEQQSSVHPLGKLSEAQKNDFEKYLHLGQDALNHGQNEDALGFFGKALLIAPDSPEAVEGYNLALVRTNKENSSGLVRELLAKAEKFVAEKKYPDAIRSFDEVLSYDPINNYAIKKKAELSEMIKSMAQNAQKQELAKEYLASAKKLVAQNDFPQALEKYSLGFALLPNFTDWKKLIKETEKQQKAYEENKFKKSLNDLAKSYQKGIYYIAAEEYSKAVTEFETVIAISRKYGQKQTMKQAEEFLRQARDSFKRKEEEIVGITNPYYKMINNRKVLGLNAYRHKEYKIAKEYFNSIIDLFPKNRFARIYQIKCDIAINPETSTEVMNQFIRDISGYLDKEPIEAKRLLSIALEIDPNNAKLKEFSKKLTNAGRTVIPKPTVPPAVLKKWYAEAFRVFTQEGDADKAKKILAGIIKEDPTNVQAIELIARIDRRVNVSNTTQEKISPQAQKYYSEGLWHYGQGRILEAKKSFDQAIRIDPKYEKAINAREKCIKYLAESKGR